MTVIAPFSRFGCGLCCAWRTHAGVKTASFYGHPYFLCTLLNFGGQQGLSGNMGRVVAGREASLANSTISGIGITMEGICTCRYCFFVFVVVFFFFFSYRCWRWLRVVPSSCAQLTNRLLGRDQLPSL